MRVQPDASTVIKNGKTTVTTAGTAVRVGSGSIKSVVIKALSTNTGFIYVGTEAVTSANGFQLKAADSVGLDIDSLDKVWINSSVNAEGVTYLAIDK